ncbi:MAG: hypothetical protein AAFV71_19600 [Cyanobacteria bacterium J06633_8]
MSSTNSTYRQIAAFRQFVGAVYEKNADQLITHIATLANCVRGLVSLRSTLL